ncbi:MAG: PKD domain-containing protein, partial [Bacteroidales bacterium]
MKQFLPLSKIFGNRRFQICFTLTIWALWMSMFNSGVQAQNCTVNAGTPDSVCVNQTLQLHGNSSGLYTAGGGNIHWSQKSGPSVNIVDPYSFNTFITGYVANQIYEFYFSAKCADGSLVYDSVWVKIKPISKSLAGTDLISCPGVNVLTLNGNAPASGESGLWQVVGTNNGVTINSPTSNTSTVTLSPSACGVTTLRWTITGTNSCHDYDDMTITNIGGVSPVTTGGTINVGGCYSATTSANLNGSFGGCGINGQSGHWTFISGPSTPTFGNANSNSSSVSNLVEGTYTFRWTVVGPCASGTATTTVVVAHALGGVTGASAGAAQVFCDQRMSFVLTGNNPLYANETGTWVQTSARAGVSIANPTSPITGVTITDPTGSYTFRYTITNSVTGCTSSASTTITYNVNPTISLTADPFIPCDDSIATIDYTYTGNGSIEWSIVSGPTNWYYTTIPTGWNPATTSPQLIYHLSGDGTYVIRFRVAPGSGNSCVTVTQEVSVTTSHSPSTANSGTPQILGCNVTSTSMAGNFIARGIGTWSFVSGPSVPVFADIHNPSSPISGLIPGRPYRLRWLVSGGPNCSSFQSDTRIIVANAVPSSADAGPDSTICSQFPYKMLGNVPALNEVGTWTVSPAGPTFSPDSHSPNAVLSNLVAGQVYTFTWTITNACGSSADVCLITTTSGVDPLIADAGPDQCNPLGTSVVTLHGNDPAPYNGLWTRISGPGSVTFADPTAYLTQASGLVNGTYTFEWRIYYPGCGSTKDTVTVTVGSNVQHANAGADRTICGTSLNLAGNPPAPGEVGRWVQIVGPGGAVIADTTLYNSLVTDLTNGVYQFKWILSNGACGTSADTVKISVSIPPSIANAGPDQLLCGPNPISTVMAATPVVTGIGIWSLVSGPNTPTISSLTNPTATVSNLISGSYIFKWTTAGGPFCPTSEDLVVINVGETANAGSDQLLCAVTQTNLVGNIGSNGVWSQSVLNPQPPNAATLLATSPNSATVSGLLTGTYTFLYTIGGGLCPNSVDSMQVTISGQPSPAVAGIDQFVCDQTSFTLAATQPVIGTGTWTILYPAGAGGSFSPNNHTYNAIYNGALSGQLYIFRWTVADGGCSNADEVRIENYGITTPCNAGPAQDICGTMTNMAATLAAHGIGTWTQISGPVATIVSPNLNTTQITGLALDVPSVFQWTVTNGVCDPCISTVTITTHTQPTTPNAGADQLLCNSANSSTLDGNSISVGAGSWSQIGITPNIAGITNPSLYNSAVTGLIPGVYTFRWTSTLGSCTLNDDMTITVYASPTTADAGPDATICLFQTITLTGNTPAAGQTGLWTQVGGGPTTAFILNPTSPVTNVTNMVVGTYQFKWTITSNPSCPSSEDIVAITISAIPSNAIAGPNQDLCNSETSATMHATAPVSGTGTWTQIGITPAIATITNPTLSNTTVTGMSALGTYTFRWTVSTGDPTCDKYDEMHITKYTDVVVAGPNDVTVCNGGTATVSVSASGGPGVYTYQWDYSATNSPYNWVPISGATNASYTTPALTSDGWYRCTVECGTVITSAAHVTVNPDPGISVQPVGDVSCLGVPTILSVTMTGGTGTFTYQWERSAGTCATPFWVPISGATASTYSATPGLTTSYHVLVNQSGNGCNSVTSNCITLTVPRILTHPTGTILCEGGTHTMSVTADNGGATLSYQWQEATAALGPWTDVTTGTGGNTTDYTTAALVTGNHYYRCVISVTSPSCADMITNTALVQVLADPAFSVESSDISMCQGGTATLNVTVTGGVGSYSYQWQQSNLDCSGTWSDISGATTNSYSTGQLNVAGSYYYHCVVSQTGVGCGPVISRCMKVTIATDPTITVPPVGATICYNGSHPMSVIVDGGTGTFTYQWQNSLGTCASPSWSNVFGATNSSYTATSVQATTSYRVLINQDGVACNSLTSGCVTVYIPHITVQPTISTNICTGGNATLSVAVTSDGGTATYAYQWQESASISGPFTDVTGGTGANSATYTTAALTSTTYYQCVITSSTPTCTLVSNSAAVIIHEDPTIDTNPQPGTICINGTWAMTVVAHGATPVLVYQWQTSPDGLTNWTNTGTNSSSYTTPALLVDTYYRVIVSATGNGCDATTSTVTLVTVNNLVSGVIATAQTICEGEIPVAFTSTTDATGDGVITYQWQSSTNGTLYTDISGATNSTYAETAALVADKWYQRIATSTLLVPGNLVKACSMTATPIKVTVNNLSAGTLTAQTICESVSTTIAGTLPTADGTRSYLWETSPDNSTWSAAPGANTGQNYTTIALTADTWFRRIATSTLTVAPQPAKACSKTSPAILITVNNFTSVNTIGTAETICENGTAALTGNTVTADGPVTYQWQSSPTNSSYTNVAGATNQNYTTSALIVDTWFQRVATSTLLVSGNPSRACTLISTPVKVTVNNVTTGVIATAQTICEGDIPAGFTVTTAATGDGTLTYQWQISTDNISYVDISGATDATYAEPATLASDKWYRRTVTSTLTVPGNSEKVCSKNSAAIKVTVNNFTSVNTIAGAQTICETNTAALTGNAVTADGTVTYQWQSSPDNGTYTNVASGGTGQNYTTTGLIADTWFRRIATSTLTVAPQAAKACLLTSTPVLVTVNNLNAGIIAVAQTICEGDIPAGFTSTADATGDGIITYQWQISSNGSSYANISGATDATYAETATLIADRWYQRIATSSLTVAGNGTVLCSKISLALKVTVNNLTAGTLTPLTICENATALIAGSLPTFDGVISYQWQMSPDNGTYVDVPTGGTGQNYTTDPITADTWYRRVVTSTLTVAPQAAKACSKISPPVLITVNNFTTVNTIEPAQTICETNTASLTGNAVTADGTVTYQWQSSPTNSSYTNVTGATNQNYTTTALLVDTWFQRIATTTLVVPGNSSKSCDLISTPVKITVNNMVPGIIAASQTICESAIPAGFTSTTPATGDGVITYQWQISTDGSTYNDITGATNATYAEPSVLTQDTWYQRIATSTLAVPGNPDKVCSKISNAIKVTVNNVTPGSIAADQTICNGGTPVPFTSIGPATGDGTITYQWQNSPDGSVFTDISGATNLTYAPGSLTSSTWYRRAATSSITADPVTCQAFSNILKVTVVPDPQISVEPADVTICSGTTTTLSVVVTGGTGSYAYQWQTSTGTCPGTSWLPISGATGQSYTTPSLTQTTIYRVLVSQSGLGCDPLVSRCVTVSVPRILVEPTGTTLCKDGTHTMSVSVENGSSVLTYQWQVSALDCSFGYFDITGATSSSYTTGALPVGARYYRVLIQAAIPSASICYLTSVCAAVNVVDDPVITVQPTGTILCSGSSHSMSITVTGGTGTFSYQWQSNTSGCGAAFTSISGATNSSYTATNVTATTYYQVLVTQTGVGCNSMTSNCATITAVNPPTAAAGPDATICETAATYTLSGSSASNYASLLWSTSGTGSFNNAGILHPVYTPSPADIASGTVTLTLNVTANSPCANTSASMILTIQRQPIAAAGPDVTRCASALSYTVTGASSTYAASLLWTKGAGTGTLTNATTISPTYTFGAGETSVTLTLTASPAGGSQCGDAVDAMVITIVPASTASAGADATICETTTTYTLSGSSATNYSSILWSTSGTGSFNNAGVLHPVYTPSPADISAGTVTLTLNVTANSPCANTSASMILTIQRQPIAAAGPDVTRCASALSYTVTGASSTYAASLLWTKGAGTGTLTNATTISPTYTFGAGETSVTLTLTASPAGGSQCGDAVDAMVITIVPASTASAGADATICETTTTYTLSGSSATNYSSILWSTSGTGSFNNAGVLHPVYTPSPADISAGTVTLTLNVTANSPCANTSASMILTIQRQPIAAAGPDVTRCASALSYTVTGASSTYAASLLWTKGAGTGTLTNATTISPTYTFGAGETSVTLTLTASPAGGSQCSDAMDAMIITIHPAATAASGGDATICQGSTFSLTSASATNYSAILWTTSGDGYFNNNQSLHPIYTPGSADITLGHADLTITATGNSPCANAVSTMRLTIVPSPTVSAGADGSRCSSAGSFTVSAATAANYSSLLWTHNGTGVLTNATGLTPTYTFGVNEIGTVTLTITATGNLPCGNASDPMVLTIIPGPEVHAGPDGETCQTTSYTISGAIAYNYTSILWTHDGLGTLTNATTLTPTYTPLSTESGTVHLTMTVTGSGPCSGASDVMALAITPIPIVDAGVGAPSGGVTCQNKPFTIIGATATNVASVLWTATGPGTLTNATTLSPTYTPLANQTGFVTLTLTGKGLGTCSDVTDQVILEFKQSAVISTPPAGATICRGTTHTMVVTATGGTGTLSYQWQQSATGGAGTYADIAGATNTSYTTPIMNIIGSTWFECVITQNGSPCDPLVSSPAKCDVQACCPITYSERNVNVCKSSVNFPVDVLANGDYSPEGLPLHVNQTPVENPAHGSIVWLSGSTFVYTPTPGYTGTDRVVIGICDNAAPVPCCTNDTIFYTVVQAVTADPGVNQLLCNQYMTFLTGNWPPAGSTGNWTLVSKPAGSPPVSIGPSNSPMASVVGLTTSATPYVFRYTISTTFGSLVCQDHADVTVTNYHSPSSPFAGNDQKLCLTATTVSATLTGNTPIYGSGYWQVVSQPVGGTTPVIVSPASPTTLVTNLSAGTYTFSWGIYNGVCDTIKDMLDVTTYPPCDVEAGSNNTICQGSTYTLSGSSALNCGTMIWGTNGSGYFNDPTSLHPVYTPGASDIALGSVVLYVKCSSCCGIPCPGDSSAMTLTIIKSPTAYAGQKSTICDISTYTLSDATATNYASVLWTSPTGGTFTPSATTVNPTYTPTAADITNGSVILTLKAIANPPCVDATSTVQLMITHSVVASNLSPATICQGASYQFSGVTASHYASLNWTTSGTGTFSNGGILNPVYSPSPADILAGTVTLTLNLTAISPCSGTSRTMELTILPAPVVNAGLDAATCEGIAYVISGASSLNAPTILWTFTPSGAGLISNEGTLTPTFTPVSGFTGEVTLTLTGTGTSPCGTSSDHMVLTVMPGPTANAGLDATVCSGSGHTVTGATSYNYLSLLWTTTGSGSLSGSTSLTPTYTPASGETSVTLTLTAFGFGGVCTISDAMTITYLVGPEAHAGADATTCENTGYTVSGATAPNSVSVLWTTNGTGILSGATSLTPTYMPAIGEIGIVTLTLTANGAGECPVATDQMVLTILPKAITNAGSDATSCQNTAFTVTSATASNYSGLLWSAPGPGVLTNETTLTPTYTPGAAQTGDVILTLTATGNSPCGVVSDQMTIHIIPSATAQAGSDATICESAVSYSLATATATNNSGLLWSTDGTGTFSNINELNPTYTPSAADITLGHVTLTLTALGTAPCGNAVDAMTLTIERQPVVNAGSDVNVCASAGSFTVSSATATHYANLLWTESGTGTLTGETTLTPTYTFGAGETGSVTLTLTGSPLAGSQCVDAIDEMIITITPSATAQAGSDATICESAVSYSLATATATNNSGLLWSTDGTGTFSNINELNPTYTPSAADITLGHVTLTLTAFGTAPCGNAVDAMTLTIERQPVVNAGSDVNVCASAGSFTVSSATATHYANLLWTESGTGTLTGETTLTPTYTFGAGETGSVTLTLTGSPLAGSQCVDAIDEMIITITPSATAQAGSDATICESAVSYSLATATATNNSGLLWSTDGTGTFSNINELNPTYTPSAADITLGHVTLTLTAFGTAPCGNAVDAMTLTIERQPVVNAGSDVNVCASAGSFTVSSATATHYANLLWTESGTGTLTGETTLTPTYTFGAGETGSVTLTLTGSPLAGSQCVDAIDEMIITITPSATAQAGSDATICESAVSYSLATATATNNSGLLWSTDGTGTFSNINELNP